MFYAQRTLFSSAAMTWHYFHTGKPEIMRAVAVVLGSNEPKSTESVDSKLVTRDIVTFVLWCGRLARRGSKFQHID